MIPPWGYRSPSANGFTWFTRTKLPSKLPRLLARSTGWLKANRIYAPDARIVQANAYFTLKMTLGALKAMRGFFVREYMLERIEHMIDRANYTSVYPRVSLAPGQRFISRSAYIVQFKADESGDLVAVTDWQVPGSSGSSVAAGTGEKAAQ